MKKIKVNKLVQFTKLLFCLLVVVNMQSCARKMNFGVSPVLPSAEGHVKIKKDGNGNYRIELDAKRLANPKRLTPPKEIYVVWMVTEGNETKNLGQLKTSEGMFSSELRSSLTTVTSVKPKSFFITAEMDNPVQYTGSIVVLKTK